MQHHGAKIYAGNFPINIFNICAAANQFQADALPNRINTEATIALRGYNVRQLNI